MRYYQVIAEYVMQVQGKKGRLVQKNITEKYLVKARSCDDANKIFKDIYTKMVTSFNIKSIKQTKYMGIISKQHKQQHNDNAKALVEDIDEQKGQ